MSGDSICRDYERGVCNRGSKCKFTHPNDVKLPQNQKLPICKDYQNKGCDRVKCKFLHVTVDEEAEYMRTGVLPQHGGHPPMAAHGGGPPVRGGSQQYSADVDVCKDFLNGVCQRAKCKFRHPTETEQHPRERSADGYPPLYGKRRRDDYAGANYMEENEMLRRKITDLQRQVLDLRQMNDTLYDQNTRYRNQLRSQTSASDSYSSMKSTYDSVGTVGTSDASRTTTYDSYTPF